MRLEGAAEPRQGPLEERERSGLALREPRPTPAPEDRPELGVHAERDAVVDALDEPVGADEEVAGLAVRIVDDGVEEGDPAEARVGGPDELDDVGVVANLDPQLDHAWAGGPVAEDGRRDDVPAARL